MKMKLLVGTLVLIASPAIGQTTTTTCVVGGHLVTCQSSTPPASAAPIDYWGAMSKGTASAEAKRKADREARAAQLIRTGQCMRAYDEALSASDLELAAKIKPLCEAAR